LAVFQATWINVGGYRFTAYIETLFEKWSKTKQIFESVEKRLDKMSVLCRNLVLNRTNVRTKEG